MKWCVAEPSALKVARSILSIIDKEYNCMTLKCRKPKTIGGNVTSYDMQTISNDDLSSKQ